jgi:uncharacterized DUF497 family protein
LFDDEHSDDEGRFILLGMTSDARLLVVRHCEREQGEVIRIVSPRKATIAEAKLRSGFRHTSTDPGLRVH